MARRAPGPAAPAALPAAAGALLALPPDRFTAARDALARELAEQGDPGAAAVRTLRRPVGLAWILNQLARSEGAAVARLLEAGDRLRAAQAEAARGAGHGAAFHEADDALRAAARALRLAAAPALAAAGRASAGPQVLARVELLLRLLAAAPDELRARFRQGALEREPAPELGLGALAAFAPAPSAAPAKTAPASPRRAGDVRHAAPPRAADARRDRARAADARAAEARAADARAAQAREAEARAAEARRAAEDAQRKRREADRRDAAAALAKAERAARRSAAAAQAADAAEARARAALDAAGARARSAREAREAAEREAAAARERLATLG